MSGIFKGKQKISARAVFIDIVESVFTKLEMNRDYNNREGVAGRNNTHHPWYDKLIKKRGGYWEFSPRMKIEVFITINKKSPLLMGQWQSRIDHNHPLLLVHNLNNT